eukprot:gene7381-8601_t
MVSLINEERSKVFTPPLEISPCLTASANYYASYLANERTLAPQAITDSLIKKIVKTGAASNVVAASEMVGAGFSSGEEFVNALTQPSGLVLTSQVYKYIGFGFAVEVPKGTHYYVLHLMDGACNIKAVGGSLNDTEIIEGTFVQPVDIKKEVGPSNSETLKIDVTKSDSNHLVQSTFALLFTIVTIGLLF